MLRRIIFSAFGAALIIGVAVSIIQSFTTVPLILQAEQYEGAMPQNHSAGNASRGGWMAAYADEAAGSAATGESAWSPADGIERTAYTVIANFVIGAAASLMLLGLMILKGDPIDARRGLLWGLAAFVAVSLLPSLGLPPQLPGTPSADIAARQGWWLFAVAFSAAGVALVAFGRQPWWWMGGIALIVVPHFVGTPVRPSSEVSYPGVMAGDFAVASLVVGAALWTLAGAASAWLYQRLAAYG